MTIAHHPDLASLMFCAAGSQPEARAAVMASHLAVCSACRAEAAKMQDIGAALFETLPAAEVAAAAPVVALRADEADIGTAQPERGACAACTGDVPGPLVPLIGQRLDDVPWRWRSPGIWTHDIPLSEGAAGVLRLFKVAPGRSLPEHGHGGQELTIVLRGSFTDELATFGVGDVEDLDENVKHTPVACPKEGCICLTATEGGLRFEKLIPRLLQPLIGL